MMAFLIWIGQSLLILGVFHFVVPTLVHMRTRNSWWKLPTMLFFAVTAAAFMTWLGYMPFLLFFVWIPWTHYTIQAMTEPKFESQANLVINKPLFVIASYAYVILSCVLAWLFQTEIATGTPPNSATPIWRVLLNALSGGR